MEPIPQKHTSRSRRSSIFLKGTPGTFFKSSSDLLGPDALRCAIHAADSFRSSPPMLSSSIAVAVLRFQRPRRLALEMLGEVVQHLRELLVRSGRAEIEGWSFFRSRTLHRIRFSWLRFQAAY